MYDDGKLGGGNVANQGVGSALEAETEVELTAEQREDQNHFLRFLNNLPEEFREEEQYRVLKEGTKPSMQAAIGQVWKTFSAPVDNFRRRKHRTFFIKVTPISTYFFSSSPHNTIPDHTIAYVCLPF